MSISSTHSIGDLENELTKTNRRLASLIHCDRHSPFLSKPDTKLEFLLGEAVGKLIFHGKTRDRYIAGAERLGRPTARMASGLGSISAHNWRVANF
jgi:hypothetical protein